MKLDRTDIRVQDAVFVFCGMFSAGSYSAVLFGLVELAGAHTIVATTVAFAVGTVVSYVLNSALTFQRKMEGAAFFRFWLVTVAGWGINVAVIEGARALGAHYALGVFVALIVAPAFNFLSHRFWTFRAPPVRDHAGGG